MLGSVAYDPTPAPPPPAKPVTRCVLGLDLGKAVDFTALTVLKWTWPPPPAPAPSAARPAPPRRPTFDVVALKRWPLGTKYVDVAAWLVRFYQSPEATAHYGPAPVLVLDETGVGSAVAETIRGDLVRAKAPGGMAAVTITGGGAVSNVDDRGARWRVAKKQLASVLLTLFEQRRLNIAPCPEREVLLREAQTFSVKITPAGNETFESWREGDHDDLVLSLALACWAATWLKWQPWPPAPTRR